MRALIFCLPVIAGAAISCADSTAPRPVPAALEIVSGDAQEGTVATELPTLLRIRVLDAKGHAVEGQVVNFLVTAGGGTLSAPSNVTNSDGLVEDGWTLGQSTADDQAVEARLADQPGGAGLVAVFHATPRPDAADTVRVVSGDGQSADENTPFADSLLVRVSDRFGNPVPALLVVWSSSSPNVTLSQSTDVTTAQGYARTKVSSRSVPGEQNVVAAVAGRSASFTVRVRPVVQSINDLVGRHVLQSVRGLVIPASWDAGNEKFIRIGSGALEILANGTGVLTEDYAYTDVAGSRFIKAFSRGVMTLKGDSLALAINSFTGVVSTTTISLDGEFSFGGSGPRIYGRTSLPTALPAPGPGTSLATVSGSGQQGDAGSTLPQPLIVRVTDAAGEPVRGQAVRFWVVEGNGTLSGSANTQEMITDGDGLAQVSWTLGRTAPLLVSYATEGQGVLAMIVSTVEGLLAQTAPFSAVSVNHH